jgi:hypothetical protein
MNATAADEYRHWTMPLLFNDDRHWTKSQEDLPAGINHYVG